MADGQVVFEITGDNRGIKDSLHDTTNAIESESSKWDKAAGNSASTMENKFTSAFKAISVAAVAMKVGKALLDFGSDAIQAASDLEEVQNVVDVTFGDGAAQIEKWAKAAGSQFGLTETQAKKFTSTLGAMMKSAGLAGPEIVDMSTDLAGLAADMASFYNLDFDTAFQKIRSGISGETEPLKQLGINMSVANLEAFALSQGIEKTFSEMTQSEQVMLRYQYLMQATADAQGDFARTSDGYANAVRTLQTNIDSLKTSVGTVLLPIVSNVVSTINDMITSLTQTTPRTVLDDFADIDLDTANKLAEIQDTANQANDLIAVLDDIQTSVDDLNKKNIDFSSWEDVLSVLERAGALDISDPGMSIENLANALEGNDPNTDRAKAWEELLAALSTDIDGLSKLTGMSAEDTAAWLKTLAEGANALDPNSAEGWDALFNQLITGLPGLTDTSLGGIFGQLAGETDTAETYLKALGYETDDITDKQKAWLDVCKRLVQTIPGLSEIINTETGEVEGGIDAIREYVTAWQEGQEKIALWKAYYAKEAALNEKLGGVYSYEVDYLAAKRKAERLLSELDQYGGLASVQGRVKFNEQHGVWMAEGGATEENKAMIATYLEYVDAVEAAEKAEKDYNEQIKANEDAIQVLEDAKQGLIDQYGEEEQVVEDAADAVAEWSQEMQDAAPEAVQAVIDALEEVQKYYDNIRSETAKSIGSVVGGFSSIVTPAEKAKSEMKDLTDEIKELNKAGKDTSGVEKQFQALNDSIPTIQNMNAALDDQLEYLQNYQKYLDIARARGVSEDILASLSDGSTESYDYLHALATDPGDIDELNRKYQAVADARESLTDSLTDTKLGADEEFQGLVDAANAAAEGLDVYAAAESAMEQTVQGIADGIAAKIPEVEQQIATLNAVLGNLNPNAFKFLSPTFKLDGSHANGLDYVPFNGYLAQLHEGESVLTAEEARVWRDFKGGQASVANTIDYEAMGGVMRDNIKPGGNVYLDGRAVGRVISDQQGNLLRQYERSGWQG